METSGQSNQIPPPAAPVLAAFEHAYREFLQALHGIAAGSGLEEPLAVSFAAYHRALESGPGEHAQRAGAEAYAWHMELLRRALAPDHNRQRTLRAFEQYLEAVRTAWAGADTRAMPPAVLGVIAQSLLAAAAMANGVAGQARPAQAGSPPASGNPAAGADTAAQRA